jgi:hypothetical protein
MEEEDFEDDMAAVRSSLTLASSVAIDMESSDVEAKDRRSIDHRKLPLDLKKLFSNMKRLWTVSKVIALDHSHSLMIGSLS